ncbi:MAG TPA: hypothetical protein VK745_02025 [Polyangiaceae bacterium]|nr:hypothetical protein [Polyangiaceae bacterium]
MTLPNRARGWIFTSKVKVLESFLLTGWLEDKIVRAAATGS